VPQLYNARRFGVELAPFPTLLEIEAACAPLPAFQAAHPDRQPDAPPPERRSP
jgi:maleylpyruvate isomerase